MTFSEKLIADGGPAFPVSVPGWGDNGAHGMTLRDYFAGQALIGFQSFVRGGWSGPMPSDMATHIADNCYAIADAMVKLSNET